MPAADRDLESPDASRYVSDVEWDTGYVPSQAPSLLSFVTALRGHAPPNPSGAYAYLDLGCGSGATVNTLAAANPRGRFYGVDLNPRHIARAMQVATQSGLENVRFLHSAFEDLDLDALPMLDYVAAHGVYSWLDPRGIDAVVRLVAEKLRPGGVFYVNYMTLPGKASVAPMWKLMRALTAGEYRDSAQRAADGLAALETLRRHGIGFFEHHPSAARTLGHWVGQSEGDPGVFRQLAHNALTEHWNPRFFTDVADELAGAGLEHVGSTELRTNFLDLCVPRSLLALFDELSPHQSELLKDFVVDRHLRHDVYLRSPAAGGSGEDHLLDHVHMLSIPPAFQVRRALPRPGDDPLVLSGPGYETLIRAFDTGARVRDLLDTEGLRSLPTTEVIEMAVRLLMTGQYILCLGRREVPAAATREAASVPLGFNRSALERAVERGAGAVLAAPVTGGGLTLPPHEALFLLALQSAGPVDGAAFAFNALRAWSATMMVDGRSVPVAQAGLEAVRATFERFLGRPLLNLSRLGVVELG